MYGSKLLHHKFFVTPPIVPSEEQKKKKRSQPTATHIMDHHLTFSQLLASVHPSSTIAIAQRLASYLNLLKNMAASVKQNFGQGCFNKLNAVIKGLSLFNLSEQAA